MIFTRPKMYGRSANYLTNIGSFVVNKNDLVSSISDHTGVTKTAVNAVIDSMIEVMIQALNSGDDIRLIDLCTISVVKREEKMGRNPKNGAPIKIPAAIVPKIRATKRFKDALNIKKKKK